MVFTEAVRGGWSRRAVLGVAGVVGGGVLSGCSWQASRTPARTPDALEPLLRATWDLVEQYERVLAAHPELAERLSPLHQANLAHRTALLEVTGLAELASPTASPDRRQWVPPTTAAPATSPEEAVAKLRDAELAGQTEAAQACLAARPGRAALLGSIAAARATHVEVLA